MKTEEDEAFDELARKQGMWGGGFTAKRKMAADKINSEFREEYIKYRTAFPKEYTAPQPAQEPVAWTTMPEAEDWCFVSGNKDPNGKLEGKWFPLYTAPPQRPWVGLTDEEVNAIPDGEYMDFYKAIEAKLKEKNNGT